MRGDLELVPFSELVEVNPNTDLPLNGFCSFVGMSDVTEDGRLASSHVRDVRESGGYTVFQDGDVLFAKITPCMENGKGARVDGLTSGVGFGSTEFHVLRPKEHVDGRFVDYWANSLWLRQKAESYMVGSAGQRRVPADFFFKYKVPLLSFEDQRRIGDILEAHDQRIAAERARLEKLRKLKAGLMDDLLTGRVRVDQLKDLPV